MQAAQEVGSTQVPAQPLSARFGLLERDVELAAEDASWNAVCRCGGTSAFLTWRRRAPLFDPA